MLGEPGWGTEVDVDVYCRRYTEKTIGYCESHDQALVGDQTVGE
jgi:1,4-alpha-glucan branching enzyme